MPNYIYFIKHRSRIKIGVSLDVEQRVKIIGKHLPSKPRLLGQIKGSYALEKHIHQVLREHWIQNEWFKDCPDVREVMARVLAGSDLGLRPNKTELKRRQFDPTAFPETSQLDRINGCLAVIWPDQDHAAKLAEAAEISVEDASAYLSGEKPIPRPIQYLIAGEVIIACTPPHRGRK